MIQHFYMDSWKDNLLGDIKRYFKGIIEIIAAD